MSSFGEFKLYRIKDNHYKFDKNGIYLAFVQGNKFNSKAIMSIIKGNFSHVDLIIDGKRYTSLGESGVGKYDIDKENYSMIFKLNDKIFKKNKIIEYYNKTKDATYSMAKAVLGVGLNIKDETAKKFFCSEWVSSAMDYASNYNLKINNNMTLKKFGYNLIDPNFLFNYILENADNLLDNSDDWTKLSFKENKNVLADLGFGEQYEIKKGIYELYGPRERDFEEKKHVISLCYRLMWNLKNTDKVKEFDEIESIYFDTVKGRPYSMILCNDGRKYIFYLGNVYKSIPDKFNNKDIEVSPNEHNINIYVNTKGDELLEDIREVQNGKNNPNNSKNPFVKKHNEPMTEEERMLEDKDNLTAEAVESVVEENKDVIENDIQDENEKERYSFVDDIKQTFEDKVLKGLMKKGIVRKE